MNSNSRDVDRTVHCPEEADTVESGESNSEKLIDRIEKLTALVQANERNEQIQRAVFKIARTSTTAETMDAFYRSIHEIVAELTSIDAIIIALFHRDEGCMSFPYYVDNFDDEQQGDESPLNNREKIPVEKCKDMLCWKVITSNEVIRYQARNNRGLVPFGKHSEDWVGIPLRLDGQPIGVFSIQSYQAGFEYREEEINLMVFISQHIASALQHLRDRESLRQSNEKLKREIEERELISQRMVELSHQAGKAEIATGILHNIGNVLNSINVSAGLAEETLRTSRVGSLKNAANLLNHQENLGEFFTNDKRGRAFPKFLGELSEVLHAERAKMKSELSMLSSHLEHVKVVVSMQQAYAGLSGLQECVSIPELLSDAELLISSSLTRHQVEVIREFEPMPEVMLEKQKLLQVIVNLLKNAKDSMTLGRAHGRKLIIRVSLAADNMLQIQFTDNGEGIAAENLTNIFSHGFTTKNDGHGFGLHSCANAMKEMDGEIFARSSGSGTGATFTLRLPCIPADSQE
ncbi:ATP-binding protein [Mariniblastus fucicola]|uniref:histidine kinase n=1 Tax=Mariniblastus fucicola TaxID=980251 RepID=A0A5B9PDU2_9BACT|nr:ATP-binding protein [Mariniblastus fucicola]QEG21113.1 Sensor protein FixL [Mariniblastus fucicola]